MPEKEPGFLSSRTLLLAQNDLWESLDGESFSIPRLFNGPLPLALWNHGRKIGGTNGVDLQWLTAIAIVLRLRWRGLVFSSIPWEAEAGVTPFFAGLSF
jgi:hypothetical protein